MDDALKISILASDIMLSCPVTVRPDADVIDAVSLMLDQNAEELPVVSAADALLGMLKSSALINRTAGRFSEHPADWLHIFLSSGRLARDFARLHGRHVSEVVVESRPLSPDAPLSQIVLRLDEENAERLPVVENGRFLGVVTRASVIRVLVKAYWRHAPAPRSDTETEYRIATELERHPWIPKDRITATVQDGIVHLNGQIFEDGLRFGIRAAVENVDGVQVVHDHIVFINGLSGVLIPSPEDAAAERDKAPPQ